MRGGDHGRVGGWGLSICCFQCRTSTGVGDRASLFRNPVPFALQILTLHRSHTQKEIRLSDSFSQTSNLLSKFYSQLAILLPISLRK